ncbi:lactonase family protein [Maribellus mangrovi]|uniref:lactonase family protein n=1 Tax=Maribellus mangrovi TaxID=3133146 RepID=UPI0030EE12BC
MTFSQNSQRQYFYVGTYTSEGAEGIYYCKLNKKTGTLTLENTIRGIDNPSFLRLSPDRKYLFAVSETAKGDGETGFVHAYTVKKNGHLEHINSQESVGDNPCHVDVSKDGEHVLVSNYSSGTYSVFSVGDDGALSPAVKTIYNMGSGLNKQRQEAPHAHSAKFSPFTNEVFNADLGTDRLNITHLEDRTLIESGQAFVKLEPGAGPRHFDFHPNGKVIYVINELNSTVSALRKEGNNWTVFQNLSTLPDDFHGESYCADIHISKDGKFLYGSNRGHNSIVIFSVNEKDQTLSLKETVSVEGNWPRNFGITPDGYWMLVANQRSNNITVFRIDHETGSIKYTGKEIKLPAPVCIEFL